MSNMRYTLNILHQYLASQRIKANNTLYFKIYKCGWPTYGQGSRIGVTTCCNGLYKINLKKHYIVIKQWNSPLNIQEKYIIFIYFNYSSI